MANPPMNWGYPRTLEGLIHLVTRGQFEPRHLTDDPARFLNQVWRFGLSTGGSFGWPCLPVAALPFFRLRRMAAFERKWVLGLLAAYLSLAFLTLAALNPDEDGMSQEIVQVFFSASFVVLAIFFGCGLVILGPWSTERAWQEKCRHQ